MHQNLISMASILWKMNTKSLKGIGQRQMLFLWPEIPFLCESAHFFVQPYEITSLILYQMVHMHQKSTWNTLSWAHHEFTTPQFVLVGPNKPQIHTYGLCIIESIMTLKVIRVLFYDRFDLFYENLPCLSYSTCHSMCIKKTFLRSLCYGKWISVVRRESIKCCFCDLNSLFSVVFVFFQVNPN